ncbi:MAG: hypothetical protein QXG39_09270 [Candidatus Aenigmatarchaeota archaeon]
MPVASEMIGIALVIFSLITFFTVILPKYLSTIVELFAKTSAENVARQLSALITVSASSPYVIEIDYIPSREVTYKVSLFGRNLKIIPQFKVGYAEKGSSIQTFPIDLGSYESENVNHFHLEKRGDEYVFHSTKE